MHRFRFVVLALALFAFSCGLRTTAPLNRTLTRAAVTQLTFKSHHGKFLTNEVRPRPGAPAGYIVADRDEAQGWEQFIVERLTGDTLAIRSAETGFYVAAEGGGGSYLVANRDYDRPYEWETFHFGVINDERIWLRAHNGKYVAGEPDGTVVADRDWILGWEEWTPSVKFWHSAVSTPGPGIHPYPVVGRIRVDGGCFRDDNGCRLFTVAHMGDLAARYVRGRQRDDQQQVANALLDLDDAAQAGHHIVRTWWRFAPGESSPWHHPMYPMGFEPLAYPEDTVRFGAELLREAARRGLRVTVGPGGIDGIDWAREQELSRILRRVMEAGGPENVAWYEAVNEVTSAGPVDRNGDEDPGRLRELVRIAADGLGVLWHLSHASNVNWNDGTWDDQRRYTHPDQRYGYYHAYRGGEVDDKIRHRFSWIYEGPGGFKRLWVDGEGVGAPTEPGVPGDPLTRVSATEHGEQMNDPEALALICAAQTLRGVCSHMSGNGVRRYMRFSDTVGWQQLAWLVRQLPRDLHTFDLITHGGRADAVVTASVSDSALLREDQVVANDGRFVSVAYSNRPNVSHHAQFRRAACVRVLKVGEMSVGNEVCVPAGAAIDLGRLWWGVVLVGRTQ